MAAGIPYGVSFWKIVASLPTGLCLRHQAYKCVKLIPAIASFLITIGASTINTLSHTGANTRLTNRQIMAVNAAASWTISSVVLTTTQTAAKVIVKVINKTKSIITHQGRFDWAMVCVPGTDKTYACLSTLIVTGDWVVMRGTIKPPLLTTTNFQMGVSSVIQGFTQASSKLHEDLMKA